MHGWKDNEDINLKDINYEDMNYNNLAQYKIQWWILMNIVMNIKVL
jgi:hypothetical protein